MNAVVIAGPSSADELAVTSVPDPRPSPGQVRIRVRGAGVCSRDLIARRGEFTATRFPAILGHEIAGEIVEVGSGVSSFQVGDRVATTQAQPCGRCRACLAGRENACRSGRGLFGEAVPGGYAELVVSDTTALVPLPATISFEAGAILACGIGTAFHAVRARGALAVGETILITGASGGVGSHAVQIARLAGARVIAVTSSGEKVAAIKSHGADEVIVSEDLDFSGDVKRMTGGQGVDVALEILGARSFEASMRSLAPTGRLVIVGNVTAQPVRLVPAVAILKELDIVGSSRCTRRELIDVIDLVERGRITPVIHRVLPLREAARAHRLLEDRAVTGRVVLTP